jgi:hypothetical protein
MPYYRSTAQRISQGFQKVLIYYFTIFLWFTMPFQSFSHLFLKEKEKQHYVTLFIWVTNYAVRPLDFVEFLHEVPSRELKIEDTGEMAGGGWRRHVGGDGVVGEHREARAHPLGRSTRPEVARDVLATHVWQRRRQRPVTAALRRRSGLGNRRRRCAAQQWRC